MPGDHIIRASYNGDINHTSANTPLYGVTIDKISDYSLIIDLTRVITVVENNIVIPTQTICEEEIMETKREIQEIKKNR